MGCCGIPFFFGGLSPRPLLGEGALEVLEVLEELEILEYLEVLEGLGFPKVS